MNDFKISLIIPAHNEEKYIGEALDHALASGGGRFHEIIVVDNLSTDATKKIAEARKGVKVVRENKKGLVMARQRGLIEATGDILAYVDADTHMPAGWLDTVIDEFSKDPNLVCLSGPYIYHDISKARQFLVKYAYWYPLGMPAYFLIGYMVTGANFAIRRSTLEKMNGFDTRIAFYGEDTNIARRASKHGKVKFKPSFVMYTSGRRLAGQGLFKTAFIYIGNFLFEAVLKRPLSKEYKDIR
jgi:glycosyltransferase involved in cell wall biosynthesis